MINVYVTYNKESQVSGLNKEGIVFYFLDSLSKNSKKKAFQLKSYWGAKLDPFAIVFEDDKPIKAFYSETGEDVINNLKNFLNYEK